MPALDWEGILEKHEMFGGLKAAARHALASQHSGSEQTYPEGQMILQEGEIGDSIFIIGKGAVDVVLQRPDESDVRLYTLRDGEIFGEMALLEHRPRSATVVAAKETTVLEIPGKDFHGLMEAHPDLAFRVLAMLSQRLRYTDDRILDSRIRGLDETISGLRSEIDKVDNKATAQLAAAKDLADKAGASVEQLRSWITWMLSIVGSVLTLLTVAIGVGVFFGIDSFNKLYETMEEKANQKIEQFQTDLDDKESKADNKIQGMLEQARQYSETMDGLIEDTRWAKALFLANLLDQYAQDNIYNNETQKMYTEALNYAFNQNDIQMLKKIKGILDQEALKGRAIHQVLDPILYDMHTGALGEVGPAQIIITYYFATISAIASNDERKARQYVSELERYISRNAGDVTTSLKIITDERKPITLLLTSQADDADQKLKREELINRLFDSIARLG